MIIITDPSTKNRLMLNQFTAETVGGFDSALGAVPGSYRSCDSDTKLYPVNFNFTASGVMDSEKEGRLTVSIFASYKIAKGDEFPIPTCGFRVKLWREATGKEIDGFRLQDAIAAMVRGRDTVLAPAAKAALLQSITRLQKEEEECSSAYAARARVAGLVSKELKSAKKTKKA